MTYPRGKNAQFSSFCEISQNYLKKLGSECVVLCNIHFSSIMCKYRFMVIVLLRVNFCPFWGGILGGRFYPGLRVKCPSSYSLISSPWQPVKHLLWYFCFVLQKTWLFHSFASETFLFPLLHVCYENGTFGCVCEFSVITISCCFGKKK